MIKFARTRCSALLEILELSRVIVPMTLLHLIEWATEENPGYEE